LAVGDCDGDGALDLVAGRDNSVTMVLNHGYGYCGDGSLDFAFTSQPYTVAPSWPGVGPCQVAVGDFNGDGKPDLAVTAYYSGTVCVLPNNGDGTGTFGTEQQFAVGGSPTALVVADFNRDGYADLAQIDGSGGGIDVLPNNADWTKHK
jgi:hypothetical protein